MQDQVRAIALVVSLAIVIVFTVRGCAFCLEAFARDRAGLWITIGEALTAIAWTLIGIDVLLISTVPDIDRLITGTLFWTAAGCKLVSVVVKSDKGYKVIRDTYRGLGRG